MDRCHYQAAQSPDRRPGAGREEKDGDPGIKTARDRCSCVLAEGAVRQAHLWLRRAGVEMHGPYQYFCWSKDEMTRSKYVETNRPAEG